MEENKNSYDKLREVLVNQFTGVIEQIKQEDIRKEEIQLNIEQQENYYAIGLETELQDLGYNVGNISDDEKDRKLSEIRQRINPASEEYARLSELESMNENIKFQQQEIENIEKNLNAVVEKNVNSIKNYQESVKAQIETRKQQVEKLTKSNETRGDDQNTNEIEQLNLEISKLEGFLSVTDNFLAKYGTLEALREAIISKQEKEEIGYWMNDEQIEYGYFDDLMENKNNAKETESEKQEPVKPEPVKTEPVKAEPIKAEPVKPEPVKPEPVKPEPVKPEPAKSEYQIVGVYCVIENNEPKYYATLENPEGVVFNTSQPDFKTFANYRSLKQSDIDAFEKEGFILPEQYIDANIFDLLYDIDQKLGTNGLQQYLNMIQESYTGKNDKNNNTMDIEYDLSELWEKPKNQEDKEKLAELKKLAKTCKKEKIGTYTKAPNVFKRMWHKITQKLITDGSEKMPEKVANTAKMQEGPKEELLTPEVIKEHYISMHDEPGFDINEFVKNLPKEEADKYKVIDADYQASKNNKDKHKQFKQNLIDWAKQPSNEAKNSSGRTETEQEKLEQDINESTEQMIKKDPEQTLSKEEKLFQDVNESIEQMIKKDPEQTLSKEEKLFQDVNKDIEQMIKKDDDEMAR